ncbi:RNA polymerase I specific transcription initiation factor RRN3 protein [Zea mays]|uniref:RNA polymerase I specific transcription initiation factor RRN3 protein n=1 Tax=Zea mays TaxID=4577 RepID=A0A1D6HG71_MAIZE|nr:RNA polymerase I specific transcription initiation factor RRN3 protein [Zea mays]
MDGGLEDEQEDPSFLKPPQHPSHYGHRHCCRFQRRKIVKEGPKCPKLATIFHRQPVCELGIPPENITANQLLFGTLGEYAGFDPTEPTSRSGGKAKAVQQIKQKMVSFVKCMLGLDAVVWDIIGSSLLEKVVYLLTELDVNITWEDILQDKHNKGIFDMELEDLAEDEHNLGRTSVET